MPGISGVEPDSGKVGTEVTITGMNFSSTPTENIVTFNGGVVAEVQDASNAELVTAVPEGAESGPILVEVDGQKTQSPSFTVIPPSGALEVTASTTGLRHDADGYTVTLKTTGEQRGLDPQGTATFEDVPEGDREIEVSEIADNCLVDGANPRTITVSGGQTTTATVNVECLGQIAFQSERTGNAEVWLMRSDGANKFNLTNDSGRDFRPRWSPNGTHIAFQSNRTGDEEVWVMDADGTNETNLTNDPDFDANATSSPDGTEITFLSRRSGNRDVWVMDADGSNPTNLTNNRGLDTPRWSPDGSEIAFVSFRTGDREVFVMDSDGADPTNASDHPDRDVDPRWRPEE